MPSTNVCSYCIYSTINAYFRAYDTDDAGIKGYYDFISTMRYANLKTSNTPLEYITNLKRDGYATSSTYINTLNTIVKKYNLNFIFLVTPETSEERIFSV